MSKKRYNNILVPVDGSDASLEALEKGIEMAKFYDATLTVAHVIDIRSYSMAIAYREPLEKHAKTRADEILSDAKKRADEAGLSKVETIIYEGAPRTAIAKKIAPEVKADLIIMGATGYGMIERVLMGSVSESTMRHATCDVLIVR